VWVKEEPDCGACNDRGCEACEPTPEQIAAAEGAHADYLVRVARGEVTTGRGAVLMLPTDDADYGSLANIRSRAREFRAAQKAVKAAGRAGHSPTPAEQHRHLAAGFDCGRDVEPLLAEVGELTAERDQLRAEVDRYRAAFPPLDDHEYRPATPRAHQEGDPTS
jgi:hypothetical protein